MSEWKGVYCYITYTDGLTGLERILCYVFPGDDHSEAARRSFEMVQTLSNVRVREIRTFAGEPRRWKHEFEVEEIEP